MLHSFYFFCKHPIDVRQRLQIKTVPWLAFFIFFLFHFFIFFCFTTLLFVPPCEHPNTARQSVDRAHDQSVLSVHRTPSAYTRNEPDNGVAPRPLRSLQVTREIRELKREVGLMPPFHPRRMWRKAYLRLKMSSSLMGHNNKREEESSRLAGRIEDEYQELLEELKRVKGVRKRRVKVSPETGWLCGRLSRCCAQSMSTPCL